MPDPGSGGADHTEPANLTSAVREYAIFGLDPRGAVTSWNLGAQRIKGYRAEEIVGRPFSVFYPPAQVAAGDPERALAEAVASGSHVAEGWRVREDGTQFWAHVVITPLFDPDGELRGFTKITRDDSDARARWDRSTHRFSGLFTLAPVGIALVDGKHRVLHANPALGELLGRRPEQLQDVPVGDFLAAQDREQPLLPAPGAQPGQPDQRKLTRDDGALIHCEVSNVLSSRDDGSPLWLVTFQDVTERVRRTEELRHQATHDALTGLPNRRGLNEELTRSLGTAASAAVLCCDLHNFTRVNDALGHEAGDELLTSLGRRLQASLDPPCTVGRMSGDEFVVVCPDIDAVGGVEALAAVVQEQLHAPTVVHDQVVRFSTTIGAAVLAEAPAGEHDLLRYADAAMADAKRRGPGRVSQAGRDFVAAIDRQLTLEEQLRAAIERDELVLHYQPIVTPEDVTTGAEALVRWPHPQRGLLGPGQFLPVAEEADLLRELERWVLRTALREAAGWPAAVSVTVNLAGLLPEDPHFVEEVTGALARSGTAPQRLVLELVETTLVNLSEQARAALSSLAERGVRFAVDDFGTGYSSLARLKDLPAQIIKTDRDFIAHIATDPADLAVVRAVATMARSLGRRCVAEGVETAAQRDALRELAVDAYQGWLLSHPLPADGFRQYLAERGG